MVGRLVVALGFWDWGDRLDGVGVLYARGGRERSDGLFGVRCGEALRAWSPCGFVSMGVMVECGASGLRPCVSVVEMPMGGLGLRIVLGPTRGMAAGASGGVVSIVGLASFA